MIDDERQVGVAFGERRHEAAAGAPTRRTRRTSVAAAASIASTSSIRRSSEQVGVRIAVDEMTRTDDRRGRASGRGSDSAARRVERVGTHPTTPATRGLDAASVEHQVGCRRCESAACTSTTLRHTGRVVLVFDVVERRIGGRARAPRRATGSRTRAGSQTWTWRRSIVVGRRSQCREARPHGGGHAPMGAVPRRTRRRSACMAVWRWVRIAVSAASGSLAGDGVGDGSCSTLVAAPWRAW